MIKDKDRSGWFGASDTATIMGNWNTKTFAKWWAVKLGVMQNDFSNRYIKAGNAFEGRILDHYGIKKRDRQIRIRKLRLRVNLDAEDKDTVYEVKTSKEPWRKVPRSYIEQVQVQMYATGKRCVILQYVLEEYDYENYFTDIDPTRLYEHPVEYDVEWIENEYLPRLRYLCRCLKERRTPSIEEYENEPRNEA